MILWSNVKVMGSSTIILFCIGVVAVVFQVCFNSLDHAIDSVARQLRQLQSETINKEIAAIMRPTYHQARNFAEAQRLKIGVWSAIDTWNGSSGDSDLFWDIAREMFPSAERSSHMVKAGDSWDTSDYSDFMGAKFIMSDADERSPESCKHFWSVALARKPAPKETYVYMTNREGFETIRMFDHVSGRLYGPEKRFPRNKCRHVMAPLWSAAPMPKWQNFTWFINQGAGDVSLGILLEANYPVYNDAGHFRGRIGSAASFASFSGFLEDLLTEPDTMFEGGSATLITESDTVIGWMQPGTSEHDRNRLITGKDLNGTLKEGLQAIRGKFGTQCPDSSWFSELDQQLLSVMPFEPAEQGLPPLQERWCQIILIPRRNVFEALDKSQTLGIGMYIALAFGCTVAVILFVHTFVTELRRLSAMAKQKEADTRERVLGIKGRMDIFTFPMTVMPFSTFQRQSQLVVHEYARDNGLLRFFDRPADALQHFIIFISHQWLGWSCPDNDNIHFHRCVEAVKEVCQALGVDESMVSVWYDYFSIPQANGIGAVQNAIDALMSYVRCSSCFVILAPSAKHVDTNVDCNFSSYMRRAWCRAEQAAYLLSKGTSCMYTKNDEELRPVETAKIQDALSVLHGEFTCCARKHPFGRCDKERLVEAMLFLYISIQKSEEHQDTKKIVDEQRDLIFPKDFTFQDDKIVEQRPLFDGILEIADELIKCGDLDSDEWVIKSTALDQIKSASSRKALLEDGNSVILEVLGA